MFKLLGLVTALLPLLQGHPEHPNTTAAQDLVSRAAALTSGTSGRTFVPTRDHLDLLHEALDLLSTASITPATLGPVANLPLPGPGNVRASVIL